MVYIQDVMLGVFYFQKVEDAGHWSGVACQDAKVIGLVSIKRFFTVIQSLSFLADGASTSLIFALFEDKGCGINTSIRYLSGN